MPKRIDIAMLALAMIFPPASSYFHELYGHYESSDELLEKVLKDKTYDLPTFIRERAENFRMHYAYELVDYCYQNGIDIISLGSEDFPHQLAEISCPPIVIFCKGKIPAVKGISIVGARKADSYSLKAAEHFSSEFAKQGISVISGFANGIDTAAHHAAVENGGKTIAVLGCGIDFDYPHGKGELKEIISANGAVISEFPPLSPPKPEYFKIRNRMISALSEAVLVIQASRHSGALNTVSHALEQGKDIFVIPPRDIFSSAYAGQILLLKDGAQAAYSPKDILLSI